MTLTRPITLASERRRGAAIRIVVVIIAPSRDALRRPEIVRHDACPLMRRRSARGRKRKGRGTICPAAYREIKRACVLVQREGQAGIHADLFMLRHKDPAALKRTRWFSAV